MSELASQSMTDWITATQELVVSLECAIKSINQQIDAVNCHLANLKEKENTFYETAVRTENPFYEIAVITGGQPNDG